MDTGHYVNSPVDEGRNSLEKRDNSHSGRSKVFRVVGVSFGLLCIIQSALNVSLRLQGIGFCNKSDHIYSTNITQMSTADISALLLEKDQLAKENRELQANNNYLTRDNEILNGQLSQRQAQMMELQTEKETLIMRLSEIQQNSCPLGWSLYMSSCYQLSTQRKNWRNAKADCAVKGAHLVILNDEMEEDALRTFGSSVVWIGLEAKQEGRWRRWTWVDGSQMTDPNRIQRQQNDQRFYCAYSEQSPFGLVTWVRAACGDQHYWVCEKELK